MRRRKGRRKRGEEADQGENQSRTVRGVPIHEHHTLHCLQQGVEPVTQWVRTEESVY